MARKDFQQSVSKDLVEVIKTQAKTQTGVLFIQPQKDKKLNCKVFVRNGAIYGIELSSYHPSIVNRIITNEYITPENRATIYEKFKKDIRNMDVVKFILEQRQLFSNEILISYIKEYFLDAFDEVYTWDNVSIEWRVGEQPTLPTVPQFNPEDLFNKLKLRKEFIESRIASSWTILPSKIGEMSFRQNYDYESSDYTVKTVLATIKKSKAGEWTINKIVNYLGLSSFNLKKTLYELWEEGVIDIHHPGLGTLITSRTIDQVSSNSAANKEPTKLSVSSFQPEPISKAEPLNINAALEEEKLIEEKLGKPTQTHTTLHQSSEPFLQNELQGQNSPMNNTPEDRLNTPAISISIPTISAPSTPVTPPQQPAQPYIQNQAPVETPVVPTTPTQQRPMSKVEEIAAQLREAIKSLGQEIALKQNDISTRENQLGALLQEKTALQNQMAELDKNINAQTLIIHEDREQLKQLEQEYNANSNII